MAPNRPPRYPDKPHGQRGRKKGEVKRVTDERVMRIATLIAANEWRPVITALALAEEWQIHPTAVEAYASDARRLVRLMTAALPGELKAIWMARLETISVAAMEEKDYKSAIEAIKTSFALYAALPDPEELARRKREQDGDEVTVTALLGPARDAAVANEHDDEHEDAPSTGADAPGRGPAGHESA